MLEGYFWRTKMNVNINVEIPEEVFLCLVCDIKIKEHSEVYHTSGIVDGKLDGHIHLCKKCMCDLINNGKFIMLVFDNLT